MGTRKAAAKQADQNNREERIASAVLGDGSVVELVYDNDRRRAAFARWRDGDWWIADRVTEQDNTLLPAIDDTKLLGDGVVLLPCEPQKYGKTVDLIKDVRSFIHRYADVSEGFELLATYYVLMSWVYDRFRELPYLRIMGAFGTGKTRFLSVAGSICYRPVVAGGASTVSPIFHLLDQFRGTLVIDEADFRFSDETAEIAKIFNCGNAAGLPVLRSQWKGSRNFEPRAFHVFGPKIVATRKPYTDDALESRFLTEKTRRQAPRTDIPISLPDGFADEALALRNRLLRYRFEHWHAIETEASMPDLDRLPPRKRQIARPLLAVAQGGDDRSNLLEAIEVA